MDEGRGCHPVARFQMDPDPHDAARGQSPGHDLDSCGEPEGSPEGGVDPTLWKKRHHQSPAPPVVVSHRAKGPDHSPKGDGSCGIEPGAPERPKDRIPPQFRREHHRPEDRSGTEPTLDLSQEEAVEPAHVIADQYEWDRGLLQVHRVPCEPRFPGGISAGRIRIPEGEGAFRGQTRQVDARDLPAQPGVEHQLEGLPAGRSPRRQRHERNPIRPSGVGVRERARRPYPCLWVISVDPIVTPF